MEKEERPKEVSPPASHQNKFSWKIALETALKGAVNGGGVKKNLSLGGFFKDIVNEIQFLFIREIKNYFLQVLRLEWLLLLFIEEVLTNSGVSYLVPLQQSALDIVSQ